MAKKQAKAVYEEVVLSDVRHSDLGMAIEVLQDELFELETLYKRLLDVDSAAASVIRQVLDATDCLECRYDEVSGYKQTVRNYSIPAWQQREYNS